MHILKAIDLELLFKCWSPGIKTSPHLCHIIVKAMFARCGLAVTQVENFGEMGHQYDISDPVILIISFPIMPPHRYFISQEYIIINSTRFQFKVG